MRRRRTHNYPDGKTGRVTRSFNDDYISRQSVLKRGREMTRMMPCRAREVSLSLCVSLYFGIFLIALAFSRREESTSFRREKCEDAGKSSVRDVRFNHCVGKTSVIAGIKRLRSRRPLRSRQNYLLNYPSRVIRVRHFSLNEKAAIERI